AATAELENGAEGRMPGLAVSPSGPLWGVKMIKPTGSVLEMEEAALAEMDITEDQLSGADGHEAIGRRRPMRVPLRAPDVAGGVDEHGAFVKLAFELPRGAYATVVLREVMKGARSSNVDEGAG
ncbi:MAG: tRNA pseudouridine(13) synthase TruD, partial [Rhodospirillales bacterium]|nr:tRNA pseudouridine(13) synthase TruD [Rhodospirillales bacterium]